MSHHSRELDRQKNSNDYRRIVLSRLHEALKPRGFRKTKALFSAERNDTVLFIQLQSSRSTTKDKLIATVNLGIFSRKVAQAVGNTRAPNIGDAHWRVRIGYFLPDASDKWWEIQSESDAILSASEINSLLIDKALPEMQRLDSTENLKALWSTDAGHGLTDYQRKRYLQALA
jgi:hypothetical protein